MAESTPAITNKIKKKVTVPTSGLMANNSKATGSTDNKTGKEFSLILKDKLEKVIGKTVNVNLG